MTPRSTSGLQCLVAIARHHGIVHLRGADPPRSSAGLGARRPRPPTRSCPRPTLAGAEGTPDARGSTGSGCAPCARPCPPSPSLENGNFVVVVGFKETEAGPAIAVMDPLAQPPNAIFLLEQARFLEAWGGRADPAQARLSAARRQAALRPALVRPGAVPPAPVPARRGRQRPGAERAGAGGADLHAVGDRQGHRPPGLLDPLRPDRRGGPGAGVRRGLLLPAPVFPAARHQPDRHPAGAEDLLAPAAPADHLFRDRHRRRHHPPHAAGGEDPPVPHRTAVPHHAGRHRADRAAAGAVLLLGASSPSSCWSSPASSPAWCSP